MTSLLGRLLRLFPESVPLEDLFTEAVARLFEARPRLCLGLLHGHDLFCDLGYQLGKVDESTHASILRIPVDGYPVVFVDLGAQPRAVARETSVAAMKKIALNEDWEAYNLDNPADWAGVRRVRSLASILQEEDHIATVKHFFIESIRQLRDELTIVKKEHPDFPWSGG